MNGATDISAAVCLVAFQRRHGLKIDGLIGPETERALRGEEPERVTRLRSPEQVREGIVQRCIRRALAVDGAARSTTEGST